VDPSALELELTEGMVADGELFPVVEGLSGMGLHIAVDDFGTGASTFGRLQTLPVDVLKIDRSLVQGREAARDASILGAIIDMAHSLGLKVVAEGVENPVQAGNLRRAGCDRGQGYLFGRPVRPEDLEAVIYCQLAYLDSPAFGTPAHRPHPAPLAPR
jgi:EAL domain-containing protein (putative c-di-GMP-specific phosphodiesterase class I)